VRLESKAVEKFGDISRSDVNMYNFDIATYCLLMAEVLEFSEWHELVVGELVVGALVAGRTGCRRTGCRTN